jgi:4-oxalocrotonate tautomerase
MPHVIVKLYSGRSEREKTRLAEEVTKAVMATLKHAEESVSVGIEDVDPKDWTEKVYKPDIRRCRSASTPMTAFTSPGATSRPGRPAPARFAAASAAGARPENRRDQANRAPTSPGRLQWRRNPSICWLPILNRKVLPVQKGEVINRQCCNRCPSWSEYGGLSGPDCVVRPCTGDATDGA